LGYKQLLEVERGWRDMKQILGLRSVYHRREGRIRAHVLLCWLALLLIRVAETTAGEPWTWNRIRAELPARRGSPLPDLRYASRRRVPGPG
jgi:hypothetical protein